MKSLRYITASVALAVVTTITAAAQAPARTQPGGATTPRPAAPGAGTAAPATPPSLTTAVRLSQSAFSKFSDFRSSLGAEVRIQLPIVNVPFRLIYAYNPQARRGVNSQVPLFFREDKSVFRFSIGRTF